MPTYLSVPEGGAYIIGDRVLPDYFWPKLGAEPQSSDYMLKTTLDGRWRYGTGSYDKTLANIPGATDPLDSKIAELVLPGYGAIKDIVANGVAVPTYYIWAKLFRLTDGTDVSATGIEPIRIAGEWTLGQGGKAMRDAYFPQFEAAFNAAQTDKQKVAAINAAKKAPGTFSWANVPTAVTASVKADVGAEAKKQAEIGAKEGATSVIVTAAMVGLIGWLLLKKVL